MAKKLGIQSPYYFISYAHNDIEAVMPIISYLTRKGYSVWYDKHIGSGTDWREELCDAISGCKAVLAMVSTAFNTSTWCRQEIDFTFDSRKQIYPIYIENCTLAPALKFQISGKQAIMKSQMSSVAFYKELLSIVGAPPNSKQPTKEAAKIDTKTQIAPKTATSQSKFNRALALVNTGNAAKGYAALKELSDSGFHLATSELADMHFSGIGAEHDEVKAYELHKKASDNKEVRSLIAIANMHLMGVGILRKDERRAIDYFAEACRLGHVDSCLLLGDWYAQGKHTRKDDKQSLYYYTLAANYNSAEGDYHVGQAYFDGKGCKKDYKKAYIHLVKAADKDYSEATYLAAYCQHHGKGCNINDSKAIEYLVKIAGKNNTRADMLLGEIYECNGLAKDAFKCYNNAQKSGDINALLKYADCLYHGYGTAQDYTKSYDIYLTVAASSQEKAMLMTAISLYHGNGCVSNLTRCHELIQQVLLVNPNNRDAKHYLANLYNNPQFNKHSTKRAEMYYLEASKLGNKASVFAIGLMHFNKQAQNSSYQKAYTCFTSSLSDSLPDSYYYAGRCAYHGLGCEQDYKAAVGYLETAIKLGSNGAANLMGMCQATGHGVLASDVKAYKCFSVAYKAGQPQSVNNIAVSTLLGKGCAANPQLALIILTKNQTSSVEAMYSLSQCYHRGIYVKVDEDRSVDLCRKAADYGYPPALKAMELLYNIGNTTIKKSGIKANHYRKMNEQSDYLIETIFIPDNFKLDKSPQD